MYLGTAGLANAAPRQPPNYTQIAATTFAADPNAYKMAYVAMIHGFTEDTIKAEPRYRDDANAAAHYRAEQNDAAMKWVNGDQFSPYVNAILKDVAGAGIGVSAGGYSAFVPKNVINKGIDDFIQSLGTTGHTPNLDSSTVINVTAWMLDAAKNPSNPDHAWAAQQVTSFLKLDLSVDYAFLPQVQQKIEIQEVRDMLQDLQAQIKENSGDPNADQQQLSELQKRAQSLMERLAKEVISAKQEIQNSGRGMKDSEKEKLRQRVKELDTSFDEMSKGFGAAAGIATLFNKPEIAKFYKNAQALSQGIGQLVTVSVTKSFEEEPMAYTSAYVAVALLVVNMMQESQKESTEQQMFDQLKQISQQVEQLREEMHQRLDVLESKADNYFRLSLFDLENIANTTIRLENMAHQLIADIEENDTEIKSGLKQLWLDSATVWESQCLARSPTGKHIVRKADTIQVCRNEFAEVATSSWDIPLMNPLPNSDVFKTFEQISDHEYVALKQTLGQLDPSQAFSQSRIHPFNYVLGAQLFLRLFQENPGFGSYVTDSNIQREDLSIANLIKVGGETRDGLTQLLLLKTQNGYALKKDVLLSLLSQYRDEAAAAIQEGKATSKKFEFSGPRPFLGARDPIIISPNYKFLQTKIGVCDDPTNDARKLYEGKSIFVVDNYFNSWWTTTDTRDFRIPFIAFGRSDGRSEGPPPYPWNETFLTILPPAMVWASRMGAHAEDLEITPCFRKIELKNLIIGVQETRITFHIELEFLGKIGESEPRKSFLLGKAVLDEDFPYHPGVGEKVLAVVPNLWFGQNCSNSCDFNWPGVVKNGALHFKPIELQPNEIDTVLQGYQKRLEQTWKGNATAARRALKDEFDADTAVSAKRKLFLLANLGLDPKAPEASEFIGWLAYQDSLPSQEALATFALESDMSSNDILDIVDAKIAIAKQQIDDLSNAQSLRPRGQELEDVLTALERLSKKKKS